MIFLRPPTVDQVLEEWGDTPPTLGELEQECADIGLDAGALALIEHQQDFELRGKEALLPASCVKAYGSDGCFYQKVRIDPTSVFKDAEGMIWYTDGVFAISYPNHVEVMLSSMREAIKMLQEDAG